MMTKNSILADYEERIDEMVAVRPFAELPKRYKNIEAINEEFYQITGQNLPPFLLSKMSDWVLMEILNDRDVDNVANSEFAILSPTQLRRRDKRESSIESGVMDYLNLKYVKNKDSLANKTKKGSD